MKIVIVCGSLEPGRDGVGDYSRRMAGELIRQGQELQIIALNDKYLSETCDNIQNDGEVQIKVLRLAANLPWSQRISQAEKWIKNYNPEWLSLQYVPFAFNKKGLPFKLSFFLKELGKSKKWHIMFHELWVGMEDKSSLKMRIWGRIQKNLVRQIHLSLKPKISHTNARLYQYQLNNIGIKTDLLPLFGNIPRIQPKLMTKGEEKKLNMIIFGGIHYGAPIEIFANEVVKCFENIYDEINLTFIGRCGNQLDHWVDICKNATISVRILGEQPLEKVSEVMQASTLGITTTPYALYDKSGSVAVMNEHQLPVICVAREWLCKGFVQDSNFKLVKKYYPGYFFNNIEWLNEKLNYTYNVTNAMNTLINKFNHFK